MGERHSEWEPPRVLQSRESGSEASHGVNGSPGVRIRGCHPRLPQPVG